ncbi:Signal peptide peptidase-like 2A [Linnemannia gamsii]|uniref:Signal peptide peptidase-like 2A n=1 Tax=Linnemannia gamsii TaxID=64522 RepID=A0ABQ7KFV4_9FUNG|nr:Signal peptide peptidase-like 2A [Linnemannia gamsii]
MSFIQAMAVYVPHLVSAPLLPLALLAITVLALSTHSAADTTVQERQMQRQKEESGESVALTKVHAIGFGVMASIGLLAMWMWSNVLVYMSLFTFALGSFVSIQQSMPDILKRLGLGRGNSWHHNGVAGLLVLSWFWNRNSSHAWIFQDILGGFTISLMLKVLKASSMSSPTLLLLTAFIYDVFFVFVTPYLTSTGESIMEAAATGAALTVKETIPMLFRIPSFRPNGGEAMLGFGDVVLPGILVTFLRECDARLEEDQSLSSMLIGMDSAAARRTTGLLLSGSNGREGQRRWSYYLTAILGFAVGLEVTFVAMMWSNQGQPALLYLVPCTVAPVVLLASKRHELSLLWNGWGGLDGEESEGDDEAGEEEKGKVLVI